MVSSELGKVEEDIRLDARVLAAGITGKEDRELDCSFKDSLGLVFSLSSPGIELKLMDEAEDITLDPDNSSKPILGG